MAAEILKIHHQTPETTKIEKVVDALKEGKVILYPTDTGFALGCQLSNKTAIQRIRQLRKIDQKKSLTFLCDSLSNISEFAKVDNQAYRTIKTLIPGPYTFILPASKNVPKFAQDPSKSTAGIRVPENELIHLLLRELGEPIISISAKLDEESYADDIINHYSKLVDLVVISDSYDFMGESSIVDMTSSEYSIVRIGAGKEKLNDVII